MTERVDVTDQAADEEQSPDRAEEAAGRQSARRRGGLAAAVGEDFDLSRAVGGKRGVVESVAPGAIFLVVYIATKDVVVSSVAPVAAAVLAAERFKATVLLKGAVQPLADKDKQKR